jgi:hypothetical protein
VLSQCVNLVYTPNLHSALLRSLSAALLASSSSLWPNASRRALEYSWKATPALGLALSGALADAGWAGWAAIAQPLLLRRSLDALEREPAATLRLLARLKAAKRLDVDQVWKTQVGKWVREALEEWTHTEENVGAIYAA